MAEHFAFDQADIANDLEERLETSEQRAVRAEVRANLFAIYAEDPAVRRVRTKPLTAAQRREVVRRSRRFSPQR